MSTETVETGTDPAIEVTTDAAEEAIALLEGEDLDTEEAGLRLFVQQGGCAGLSYGMRFDTAPEDDDLVVEHHGLRVFVDPASRNYIGGVNLTTNAACRRLASRSRIRTLSRSAAAASPSARSRRLSPTESKAPFAAVFFELEASGVSTLAAQRRRPHEGEREDAERHATRVRQITIREAYVSTGACPYDRDPESCEAMEYTAAFGCLSSESPHALRRGGITHHLNSDVPKDVVSDRANVRAGVLDEHYDRQSQREEMEQRRGYLADTPFGEVVLAALEDCVRTDVPNRLLSHVHVRERCSAASRKSRRVELVPVLDRRAS